MPLATLFLVLQADVGPRARFADLHELLPEAIPSLRIVPGDVDGDGAIDFVLGLGQPEPRMPVLWRNLGDGRFVTVSGAFGAVPTFAGPWVLALGDVDGDGDLDLYFRARLFRNDGDGVFELDPTPFPGAPEALRFADVDGDGDLDAFGRTAVGAPNGLWRNDGGGVFTSASDDLPPGATAQSALSAGDVDGDGDLDLLACSYADTSAPVLPRLYENLGPGFAERPGAFPQLAPGVRPFLVDVDLDSDVDALAAGALFLNDGHGSFADASARLPSAAPAGGLWLDADGDLDPDLVFEGFLWRNESGWFVEDRGGLPLRSGPYIRAAADIDRDGDPDLVGVSWIVDSFGGGWAEIGSTQVLLNDGHGEFLDVRALTLELPTLPIVSTSALADLDGDGALDALAGDDVSLHVSWGDGAGRFEAPVRLETSPTQLPHVPRRIAAADLDRDGDVDVLVSGRDWDGSSFDLLRAAGGVYTREYGPGVGDEFALGDVDADGDLDVLGVSWTVGGQTLYRNDGSAFVRDATFPTTNVIALEAHLADADGDGDLDAFLAATPPVLVRNEGGTGWSDASAALGFSAARSLAPGDLDGDGDADVVVADGLEARVHASLGMVYGPGVLLTVEGAERVRLVDADADGDLDALVELAGGATAAFENVAGELVPAPWTADLRLDGASFGDVDGDGDLDHLWKGALRSNLTRQIAWRTPPALGRTFLVDVYGPAAAPWVLSAATRPARLRSPLGLLLIDPRTAVRLGAGRLDADGRGELGLAVPAAPELVGAALHLQAAVGSPARLTNRETVVLTGL